MKNSTYVILVAMFASVGTILYGFDTGIATTTIAHPSWVEYMNHPSAALTGAVPAIYIAGEAMGALLQVAIGDALGRIRFIQLLCVIVTIGTTIQTASNGIGMFLAGRAIAGTAVGALIATNPVYLTEISPPANRGLIAGISGLGIAAGTALANWIGFAGSYAPYGQTQWRLPLGLQIPWGIILGIGSIFILPNSPRWLIRKGRDEEARKAFLQVRRDLDEHEVEREFALMRAQILFEKEREVKGFREIWRRYKRRALVSIGVQTMTSLTGVNVIQYYQTINFKSLGMDQKTILALAAVYGTIALLSNIITSLFIVDRYGRRPMLLIGLSSVVVIEIYTAVMQMEFQDTNKKVGKGFAILGIYLFVTFYYGLLNSTTWTYGSEVAPVSIRSKVMGLAAFSHFVVNVGLTEAGPAAFANIEQNYYYVFVACSFVFFWIAYFFFPETKGKTLEELAEVFHDDLVDPVSTGDLQQAREVFHDDFHSDSDKKQKV